MSGVMSALPVRNSTSPCKPSSTSEASSLAVWAVCTFCERSSSLALRAWLLSASWLFSLSKVDFSLCNCDLSLSSKATCISAFLASLARWTRLPSHVPSPAPTTAPIGPAANAPITPPTTNPAGSCGGRVFGSSAKAAALTPINPIVHTHLEYLEYLVLMTNSSLLAIRGDDRRPMEPLRPRIRAVRRWSRGKSWRRRDELQERRSFSSSFQREGGEVGADVVVVLLFGLLEEGDHAIGQGRCHDFPAAFQRVLGKHDQG